MSSPATFDQPAGWVERATMLDDSAPHQIRIQGSWPMSVSCTCRHTGIRGAGMDHCDPIAEITTCEQAWTAYNAYHSELLGPNGDEMIDTQLET